jgi:hypothetical protein
MAKTLVPDVLVPRKTFIVHAGGRIIRFLKGRTTIVVGHPLLAGREDSFRPLEVDFGLDAANASEPEPEPTSMPAPDLTDEQKVAASELVKSVRNRGELDDLARAAGIAEPSAYDTKADLAAAIVALKAAIQPPPAAPRPAGSGDESNPGTSGDEQSPNIGDASASPNISTPTIG